MTSIDKLNDTNYALWRLKMEALLDRKGLAQYIDWDGTVSSSNTKIGDRKARGYMILNIGDDPFKYVRNCETAKTVWDALAIEHESKTFLALIELETKYASIIWNQKAQTLDEFLYEFLEPVRQPEASGNVVDPSTSVRKLMSVMSPRFRAVSHKLDQYPKEKQNLTHAIHALREEHKFFQL